MAVLVFDHAEVTYALVVLKTPLVSEVPVIAAKEIEYGVGGIVTTDGNGETEVDLCGTVAPWILKDSEDAKQFHEALRAVAEKFLVPGHAKGTHTQSSVKAETPDAKPWDSHDPGVVLKPETKHLGPAPFWDDGSTIETTKHVAEVKLAKHTEVMVNVGSTMSKLLAKNMDDELTKIALSGEGHGHAKSTPYTEPPLDIGSIKKKTKK